MNDVKKILVASIPVVVGLLVWELVGKKIVAMIPIK